MSPANYVLRFATGFDGMMMVLSGMNDMAQMQDNLSFMKIFNHYLQKNKKQLNKSQKSSKVKTFILCIACRYCMEKCPKNIAIPD